MRASMISVVTFKWNNQGYRSSFSHRHVNTTRRMIARHYPQPHRFICVTDDPVGLDEGIEYIPLWDDHAKIPNPSWPQGPSCYRRLKVFSDWFAKLAGERIVCVDLDAVFTGDLMPLFNRTEDFLIWQTGNPKIPFCASMFMFTAGIHTRIWTDFDPMKSPRLGLQSGMKGSDQSWIAHCLGLKIPGWGTKDGVYGYKDHLLKGLYAHLPVGARCVMFTGKPDPWEEQAIARAPWIKKHYV
jgi:hypothetical protein